MMTRWGGVILLCFVVGWPGVCPAPPLPSKVNGEALAEVEKVFPGYRPLVHAIRVWENGYPGMECGNHGHTQFAREYPAVHRNYLEAGRSVAKFTLEYGLLNEPRPEFFVYLASRYHAGTGAGDRDWANGVRSIYRKLVKRAGPRNQHRRTGGHKRMNRNG